MKKFILLILALCFASLSGEEAEKKGEKNYYLGLSFPFFSKCETESSGEIKYKDSSDKTVTVDSSSDSSKTTYGIEFMEPTFVAGKKISESLWITTSFSLKKNSSDSKTKLSYEENSETVSKQTSDETTLMITLGLKYNFMMPDNSSALFIHPQVAFTYIKEDQEEKTENKKNKGSGTGYGFSLQGGYEKLVTENVSLGVYGAYRYVKIESETEIEESNKNDLTNKNKHNIFELGLSANVYF